MSCVNKISSVDADSPDETYDIPLKNEADAARIMIRATDVMQNVASLSAGRR